MMPFLMGIVHRPGQGLDQGGGLGGRLGRAAQLLLEAAALEQFQGKVGLAVVVADLVDLDEVGVLKLGHRPRLGQEPRQVHVSRGQVPARPDHLQGHQALELKVAGLVDDAHAPLAQLAEDLVAGYYRQMGRQERIAILRDVRPARARRLPLPCAFPWRRRVRSDRVVPRWGYDPRSAENQTRVAPFPGECASHPIRRRLAAALSGPFPQRPIESGRRLPGSADNSLRAPVVHRPLAEASTPGPAAVQKTPRRSNHGRALR